MPRTMSTMSMAMIASSSITSTRPRPSAPFPPIAAAIRRPTSSASTLHDRGDVGRRRTPRSTCSSSASRECRGQVRHMGLCAAGQAAVGLAQRRPGAGPDQMEGPKQRDFRRNIGVERRDRRSAAPQAWPRRNGRRCPGCRSAPGRSGADRAGSRRWRRSVLAVLDEGIGRLRFFWQLPGTKRAGTAFGSVRKSVEGEISVR